MKVLVLFGSHRKKGNTAELLRLIQKRLKTEDIPDLKIKAVCLPRLDLKFCHACLKCKNKGYCVLSDDFGKISSRLLQSDLIILGSPVYFSDVSAPVKTLIDRSISLWHKKQLKGKKLVAVTTCAESGTEHTINTLKHWAKDHEMEFISGIEGKREKKGEVLGDEKAMNTITELIKVIKSSTIPPS